ncbi:hypothetical protein MAPG_05224 [Magnaporthiopsis poae ATCC 64411]|uniref:Uncharacterized protein n=1 Tax=Magnaporthiopsis poae (strain ATCC 64411 / 73-15) TaxID=644358 RepID=A0A0C4DYU5_MAGP6|nr:hypothetical protein MAPG_05224 [Magnaporthiopsis poae ATCC 64411]
MVSQLLFNLCARRWPIHPCVFWNCSVGAVGGPPLETRGPRNDRHMGPKLAIGKSLPCCATLFTSTQDIARPPAVEGYTGRNPLSKSSNGRFEHHSDRNWWSGGRAVGRKRSLAGLGWLEVGLGDHKHSGSESSVEDGDGKIKRVEKINKHANQPEI